jgi:endonuclease/exonuclease/phosphatase family metal-dependent hydrolase
MSLRGSLCLALAGALGSVACGDEQPEPEPYPFEAFEGEATAPDVLVDRLCTTSDPALAPDPVFIDCRVEGAGFAPTDLAPTPELVVMTYNMERGLELDQQIALLGSSPDVPRVDLLLVSEVDRGCSRTAHRNVPRELAEALSMNYVFAVEFVELPRDAGPGGQILEPCEHGNAIFSKYPLGNVSALRHTENKSWLDAEGEPRLGGRVLVIADVKVGDRFVHAYSLHFESSPADNEIQIAQAIETAEHGLGRPHSVVQAGDTNAPFYFIDLLSENDPKDGVTQAFFTRGYLDAHAELPYPGRETRENLVLDIIFGHAAAFSEPAVCAKSVCEGLSDHLPVWATLAL